MGHAWTITAVHKDRVILTARVSVRRLFASLANPRCTKHHDYKKGVYMIVGHCCTTLKRIFVRGRVSATMMEMIPLDVGATDFYGRKSTS